MGLCYTFLITTVVRATRLVNGTFLDPRDRKPLNRSTSNLIGVIRSGTSSRYMQTLVFLPLRGRLYICVKLSLSVSIFNPFLLLFYFLRDVPVEIAPLDRFSCFVAQNTCFGDIYVLFEVQTKNNIFQLFFAKKSRNSLFPQCKTSIGNNSGSIKDKVVKFAGGSAIADQLV